CAWCTCTCCASSSSASSGKVPAQAAERVPELVRLPGLRIAQGDLVGLGDAVCLDRSQSLSQTLPSLPQQLEGVAGRALRGGALRIGAVFLDEVSLECCRDFVGRLQCLVDGSVPCSVVNHCVLQ